MKLSQQHWIKIGILLAISTGIIVFFIFDLQQYLTLDYLRNSKELFAQQNAEHPFLTIGIYIIIYMAVTALSLPGAVVMTLAGGTLFGLVKGTIAVSFASTIGATVAMLVARTLMRDYVQGKFHKQIQVINKKIEEEGSFYLFTMRLVPAFPFFVINLVMGLTPMRVFTFAWVSQVGMLAGTIVYVNAGSELGKIESLGDIASPQLLLSFALLGVLPLLLKKLVGHFSQKQETKE
ncbi:MAG: TVP38/TMEM64 family protein [SAR324 cluster bacterium]|nr:TVP38/TMEM64 family protein [SAR324 cluster bacterium]